MRSVMDHSFSQVPRANIPRSSFNRSHAHKTTFDADYLIPIFCDDVVPGDTFNCQMHFFARLATPLYPIMDNMHLDSFFFFVPYRLVWENWEKMHGAQDDPDDSIDYTVPGISSSTSSSAVSIGSLYDYFGLPTQAATVNLSEINTLPFRAYNLIWNEWFRDQNLQDSLTIYTGDGASLNNGMTFSLLKRGKRHDYFTSCLPWPQKGDAVAIPLGNNAPIYSTAVDNTTLKVLDAQGSSTHQQFDTTGGAGDHVLHDTAGLSGVGTLYADLSGATDVTINDLRLAFQTQRLLERDARSGTRYNELILAHFGVTVPDFRVQRPEFLGGGSSAINVTPVAQTSGQPVPASNDKLGELAAFGTVRGRHGFTKSFVEHGVVIGLINARGDLTYQEGLDRYFSKSTRYDFFYPVLAMIGEQSVLNSEIWYQNSSADDDVFGYQERYAEYRYKPSRLSGLMRSDAAQSLDAWHIAEDFSSLPTLGSSFIESNLGTPLDRAIAINTEPHFIFESYFDLRCARPMPIQGVPGNLDHF